MQEKNSNKVILITGANRGIGFGIVKALLPKGFKVILTSRDVKKGLDACETLQKFFREFSKNLFYCELDISKKEKIESCAEWVKEKFGKIDILFNNAGTAFGETELLWKWIAENNDRSDFLTNLPSDFPSFETVELFDGVFGTNVFGTINMTHKFLEEDLIKHKGKIITITSSAGNATRITNEILRKEICSDDLELENIYDLCSRYRKSIENKTMEKDGWMTKSIPIYSNSKLIMQAYCKSLKKNSKVNEREIQVYACCPGWVATDLGGKSAVRTVEQGVITPVYLIELPFEVNKDLQGKFFYTCKVFDWENSPVPVFEA